MRHFLGMVVTILIAVCAVVLSFKLLVGAIKLVVAGAAFGIGVAIVLYLIFRMNRPRPTTY